MKSVVKKRRKLLAGLLGALLLAGIGYCLWIMVHPPRAMRPTLELVKKGMSRSQVISTVGCPPGNYGDSPFDPTTNSLGIWHDVWNFDDAKLLVFYDSNGTAEFAEVRRVVNHYHPTLIERIRRFLHL